MDVDDAVGWALRVAKTLEVLHRRGLAHGNLCARAIEAEGPGCHASGTLLSATRAAVAPSYQSVERAAGEPPTPADDVWATGALLYHALTGEPPFGGRGPTSDATVPRIADEVVASELQPVLDRIFHAERTERLVTAHSLVMVLSKHHPHANDLVELELPADSVRASHRVRHASRPILDAVTAEEASLGAPDSGEPTPSDSEALWAEDRPTLPHARVAAVAARPAASPAEVAADASEKAVAEEEYEDDVPQRNSEEMFLGWLGDTARPAPQPAPAADSEATAEAAGDPSADATDADAETAVPDEAAPEESAGASDDSELPTPAAPAASGEQPADAEAAEAQAAAHDETPAEGESPASTGDEAIHQPSSVPRQRAQPAQDASPPPARRRRLGWPAQLVIALVVIAVAYLLFHRPSKRRPLPSRPATSSVAPATPPASVGRALALRPTSTPAGSRARLQHAASSGAGDRAACVVSMFPHGTFSDGASGIAAVCQRTRPGKGVRAIKHFVVEAGHGHGVTDAMLEWSRLGWYEMAAFAAIHGRCCSGEIELSHARFRVCDFGERLRAVHAAARTGEDIEAAVVGVEKSAKCVWQSNNAKLFKQGTLPTGQQLDYLRSIVGRTRK